jgi:hypothetical protein
MGEKFSFQLSSYSTPNLIINVFAIDICYDSIATQTNSVLKRNEKTFICPPLKDCPPIKN